RIELAHQVSDGAVHFLGGSVDRQLQRLGLVRDRQRLMALGPCLDLATLVGGTGLLRVLVTDVDFHPHQEILETPEPLLYRGADPFVKLGTAFDMVASHLDLHRRTPLVTYLLVSRGPYRRGSAASSDGAAI